ncbi:MAG: iron-containing alcohol dehydrogenase [Flavobacteriales bacterium]|nr:iron-containing alcohol dehydrogenase [Flavobacteriales bacterium]
MYSIQVKNILPTSLDLRKCILITGKEYSLSLVKEFSDLNSINLLDSISEGEIKQYSTIVAFGGGKTLDRAKKIAYDNNKDLILIPSIISNDGISSPLLSFDENKKAFKQAKLIVWDFVLNFNFPDKYLYSAFGDIFSSFSAINDFIEYSNSEDKTDVNKLLSSLIFLFEGELSISETVDFIKQTGLVISNHKSSYPVSGAEHKIAHSISRLGFAQDVLHGNLVASISIFTLFLQENLNIETLKLSERINVIKNFTSFDDSLDSNLLVVFEESKKIRSERKTIIDKFSSEELLSKFRKFELLYLKN